MENTLPGHRSTIIFNLLPTCWLCLILCCSIMASAQARGHLRLPNMPPTARLYVDAKPVVARDTLLALPPGWHQVQVEKQEKSGLKRIGGLCRLSRIRQRT